MENIKNDKKQMIMEQIKNNENKELMLIIAIVVLIVLVVAVISSNKLSANQCIGKWEEIIEVDKINKWTRMYVIELYEGGTGKITSRLITESSYEWPNDITWEIKDNILNITENDGTTTGYKLKNKILTTVDGNRSYNKVK